MGGESCQAVGLSKFKIFEHNLTKATTDNHNIPCADRNFEKTEVHGLGPSQGFHRFL